MTPGRQRAIRLAISVLVVTLGAAMGACSFEVTDESDPTLLEGNPLCPSAEMLDAIPDEMLEYVQMGIGVGFQLAFDAMMGSIEDEMDDRSTGPARSVHPVSMKMVQQNHPDSPNLTNTLGFQSGLEIFLEPPVGAPLDTAKLFWAEDIPQNAEVIEFEVNADLDMLPYMDRDSITSSVPTLRTCNREDVMYVTITTVEVTL